MTGTCAPPGPSGGEGPPGALRVVIDRIEGRLAGLTTDPDPRTAAEQVLHELLPLDAERRAENEVWFAFTARARVDPTLHRLQTDVDDPTLHRLQTDVDDALRRTCATVAASLAAAARRRRRDRGRPAARPGRRALRPRCHRPAPPAGRPDPGDRRCPPRPARRCRPPGVGPARAAGRTAVAAHASAGRTRR